MGKLENKTALITGATGGIGLAAVRLFSQAGAKVLMVDLDEALLAERASELRSEGAAIEYLAADVSSDEAMENACEKAVEAFGELNVAFLNAGIEGAIAPISEYPLEQFEQVMAVNVRGVFLGLKHAIPRLKQAGGGSIVITSSLGGLRGTPKIGPYIASKHAVVGLMKSAALECASLNIRVNTINPAPIATRMIEALEQGYAPGQAAMVKQKMEKSVPLRRYGQPEEVAQLALFLASDDASFITGNAYPIDGGVSAA